MTLCSVVVYIPPCPSPHHTPFPCSLHCQGPFVKLEELVQTIDTCVIPEHFAPGVCVVWVCVYVCVCVHICACVYVCMCVCMYVCVCVCMYVCMCVCMYVCVCVCMCMYICMCVCMYVCNFHYSLTAQPLETTRGAKRKLADGDGEESDDEEGLAPPINDLYRSRQQKRTNTSAP